MDSPKYQLAIIKGKFMKLSKQTIDLFKNFATINSGIVVKEGNALSTMSTMKTVFAKATVAETFPKKFAIYSLPELLGVIGMFSEPEIEFSDTHLTVSEGTNSVKYYYASEGVVVSPPSTEIKLPETKFELLMTAGVIEQINKAAAIMKFDVISISKKGIRAYNSSVGDANANQYTIGVEVATESQDSIVLKIENMKLIPGDYHVKSAAVASQFISTSSDLVYTIAHITE